MNHLGKYINIILQESVFDSIFDEEKVANKLSKEDKSELLEFYTKVCPKVRSLLVGNDDEDIFDYVQQNVSIIDPEDYLEPDGKLSPYMKKISILQKEISRAYDWIESGIQKSYPSNWLAKFDMAVSGLIQLMHSDADWMA